MSSSINCTLNALCVSQSPAVSEDMGMLYRMKEYWLSFGCVVQEVSTLQISFVLEQLQALLTQVLKFFSTFLFKSSI